MSTLEWKRYYGFSRTPFSKTLAPSQLLGLPGHLEAVARIRWAIDERGIGVLTGEVGVGKTVAARAAVAALDASKHTIVYLPNPAVGARGIHQHLAHALGVAPRFHRGALITQTADLLARERDERDKHTVLIIDEAHLLDPDQLEQIRILTNTDMDADTHLAIVLLRASPPCAEPCAAAATPRSTNASPPAPTSTPSIPPKPPTTSATTSPSPAAPTPCSPTTPPTPSPTQPAGCPAKSATSPSPRSSPATPDATPSSTPTAPPQPSPTTPPTNPRHHHPP